MRIFTHLLIFICLSITPRLYGQQEPTITLSVKNVPLEAVLGQIKKQSGVTFVYNNEILKKAGKISIQVDKADVPAVLKQLFQHTAIKYVQEGNIVILTNKTDANGNISIDDSYFSTATVTGNVYDATHAGLNGATVTNKRTHLGTITNAKGAFQLENVRSNDTLQFSYIGYTTQNIAIISSGQSEINVNLNETQNELDQVVVQAYGTTTKRLAVGEISQVNAKDIEKQPLTNPILALEGMVPGMVVTPTSGYSGAPVKIVIRGQNSVGVVPTDPLYIIDGVPLLAPPSSNGGATFQSGNYSQGGGQSPFFSLNPNDIESISVLKDAAATAMYGSRAGNGVIIITTKKGKPGEIQFNISMDHSINKTIGTINALNTTQYLQMRREALLNDGLTPTVANAPDLTLWDTTRNVDWAKELLKNSSTTNVQTSLSGGNNFITFRLSAGYTAIQDFSALSNANKDQKATANLNLDYHSANQKLSISVSTAYGYTNTNQVAYNIISTLPPDAPPIFDKEGSLNYAAWNAAGLGNSFPFNGLLQSDLSSIFFLNSNITANYQLIKGLNIGISMGYNNAQSTGSAFIPIAAQNPANNPLGSAKFGNSTNIGIDINPQVTYEHYIGKGKLQALVGATLNNTSNQNEDAYGTGYTDDVLLQSIANAPVQTVYQNYSQNKYLDVHGRLNYNWSDKYILEVTGNRDGSSSFGPGRQFGNFWSAGANWIASEEKWLKALLPAWVSLIKLSGTYGTTGISGGDYQYLSQWSSTVPNFSGSGPLYPYNGNTSLVPINAVNQDYRWETDKQSNLSFDLGFLNDRFNIHVAWYQKRVNDQLTTVPTPLFTGFATVEGNSKADVQNTGTEITLTANIINTKDFSWSANFNFSHNANKLLAFPGIEYTPYYTIEKVGYSVNTVYVLHYLGIDPQTGQRSYEDYNHDGIITSSFYGTPGTGSSDARIPIDLAPKFSGGGSTNFRYKNLTLGLQFNFEKKMTQVAYFSTPGVMSNIPIQVFNNSWQKPGDKTAYPRFTTIPAQSDQFFNQSDSYYTDGSFIRLENVNISYALPGKLAKSLGMQGISLAISMQNVLTFTKYIGVDPDAPFGSLPLPKTFNGRVMFNF